MSSENKDSSAVRRRVSCTKCFDALWFCYSPFYQMQQYYRVGRLDDFTKKFSDLFDCLSLKTKTASEAEKILEEQEMAAAAKHIWIMRTQEEASSHWNETFGHLDDPNSWKVQFHALHSLLHSWRRFLLPKKLDGY